MSIQYKARIEKARPNPFMNELLLRVDILAKYSDQRKFRYVFGSYVSGDHRPTPQEVIQIAMDEYAYYLRKEQYINNTTGEFTFEVDDNFQISNTVKQDD